MKIGTQMYTIREFAQTPADIEKSLEKLANIGYKTVQVSGIGAIEPHKLRELCDKFGIEIIITHSNPDRIMSDTEKLIAEHKILGCSRIGIGSMPRQYWGSVEGVRQFIKDYTPAMNILVKNNMRLHYHNHAFEFERQNGEVIFDVMINETSSEQLAFILDTYWVQVGGRSVAAQIEALKGRLEVCHFKDLTMVDDKQRMAEIMNGNLPWNEIVKACKNVGCEYAMIEQDDCYGTDPFECLATSFKNCRQLLL